MFIQIPYFKIKQQRYVRAFFSYYLYRPLSSMPKSNLQNQLLFDGFRFLFPSFLFFIWNAIRIQHVFFYWRYLHFRFHSFFVSYLVSCSLLAKVHLKTSIAIIWLICFTFVATVIFHSWYYTVPCPSSKCNWFIVSLFIVAIGRGWPVAPTR